MSEQKRSQAENSDIVNVDVRIVTPTEENIKVKNGRGIWIDGKFVRGAQHIEFSWTAGGIPVVNVTFVPGSLEIDGKEMRIDTSRAKEDVASSMLTLLGKDELAGKEKDK